MNDDAVPAPPWEVTVHPTQVRLPAHLRRRAAAVMAARPPRRCWCGRTIPADSISTCGCCCPEHDDLADAMRRHPSGKETEK